MIYCIGGVSGSGKSTLIRHHPELKDLVHIDIADMYQRAEQQRVRISWQGALNGLLNAATPYLTPSWYQPKRSIVLEAFFKPGGLQRQRIVELASSFGEAVTFIWCHASRSQCNKRVRRHQGDSSRRRYVRLRFIRYAKRRFFRPREGEGADEVLDSRGRCERCGRYQALSGPYYCSCKYCTALA